MNGENVIRVSSCIALRRKVVSGCGVRVDDGSWLVRESWRTGRSACATGVAGELRESSIRWRFMRFDLVTIFPEFFAGPLQHGIVRRAQETGLISVNVQDLREFTKDRHRTVDDRPFGGGEGMVLKPEPLFQAVEKLLGHSVGDAGSAAAAAGEPGGASREPGTAIVLMSAAGKL